MHGLRKLYKLLISRHHRILANDRYLTARLLGCCLPRHTIAGSIGRSQGRKHLADPG